MITLTRRTALNIALLTGLLTALGILFATLPVHAATTPSEPDDFSLDVNPSVLSANVKPGTETRLELKIRNGGAKAEKLKIETRSFTISRESRDIKLSTSTPADLAKWVSYASPTFEVAPGEWFSQSIAVNLPADAGFSYPFAVVISRADGKATEANGRLIKGSVAVFALVNVDKPGATRTLEIDGFSSKQQVYEFLPATVDLKLRNAGNSIVQPYGNVYLQRGSNDPEPLAVMPINSERGYILPGNVRTFDTSWSDGFPYYKTVTKDGKTYKELVWNWDSVSKLRIGRYTAKVVAVYNDGRRDVPVIAEVGFWVIPWRIIGVVLIVLALIGFGIWSVVKGILGTARRLAPHKKE